MTQKEFKANERKMRRLQRELEKTLDNLIIWAVDQKKKLK